MELINLKEMFKAGEEKQVIEFIKEKLFVDSGEIVSKITIIDPYFFSKTRFYSPKPPSKK